MDESRDFVLFNRKKDIQTDIQTDRPTDRQTAHTLERERERALIPYKTLLTSDTNMKEREREREIGRAQDITTDTRIYRVRHSVR